MSEQPPIILGQVYLSFYAVTGAVVHEVLERLGHTVEVREGPHEEIFPLLEQDVIDLMAAVWLPEGHGAYWAKYGRNAIEITQLYDGAHFFWAVPNYVPADEVASISDLGKPMVAKRMTKLIQGIGSGATISVVSKKAVAEYGLEGLGYAFRPGTAAEWIGALNAAMAEGRWIIFPTWAPQYLNRENRIRALQDPRGITGGTNHASLVSPRNRFERLPLATRVTLSRIELGIDGVTEMDWLVNVAKQTPREAARKWMAENDKRVAGWLKA
jgi:glycine betaine/proline transport system substrate-binding protein